MATFRTRTGKNGTTVTVMVRLAGFPTATETFANMTLAKRWATTTEADMMAGRTSKDSLGRKRTLADAIDRYTKEVLPQKRDGSMYRFTLAWWKANHGTKRLGEITRGTLATARTELLVGTFTRATPGSKRSTVRLSDVFPDGLPKVGDRYLVSVPRGPGKTTAANAFQRTPATANRYMAALSHVFTMACGDWEWLPAGSNPFTGLSKLREAKGRTRHLSADEHIRLMIETAKDPQLHVMVCLALATAARAGELVGLTWAQVEIHTNQPGQVAQFTEEGRLLFEDTKNGETRVAWVFGEARELLQDHRARNIACINAKGQCMPAAADVFPGQWSHKHQAWGKYDYMPRFRKALTAAGIKNFRFHDLRHSAATGLARMGASEQQLKAIGGWKSTMASRYIHLAAQDTKAAVQAWNNKLDGPKK